MALWQEWWVWGVAGVVLAILEVMIPGFILLGFAIGALLTDDWNQQAISLCALDRQGLYAKLH